MTDHAAYFAYLKTRSRRARLYRRFFLYPRLNRHISGVALDIGCGLGDMLGFRPNTVGADVNPYAVEYCRNRGFDAHLIQDDHLPFAAASFDTVVLDNVLEHIVRPQPLLDEIHRVLKKGGGMLIGVPGTRGYASDPDHKVFYDEAGLVSTVQPHGFSHLTSFHIPWRSAALSARIRQYCLYAIFRAA
jgi:SAM-dependent methyltransferase